MFCPSATRIAAGTLGAAVLAAGLAGCSSAADTAAQDAYDACVEEGAEVQLLHVDGPSVFVEVIGKNAKALSHMEGEMDSILEGSEPEFDGPGGLAVGLAMLGGVECLVEETGFPGASEDLEDRDQWDGWRYDEESGAGSETTMRFTATD